MKLLIFQTIDLFYFIMYLLHGVYLPPYIAIYGRITGFRVVLNQPLKNIINNHLLACIKPTCVNLKNLIDLKII